jgi:hypothetical protein
VDSTDEIIQRTTKGIQKMIRVHESPAEEGKAVIQINPAIKRHFELEIKILQDAPRDEMKLRQILAVKQKEYEKAIDSEDIERLVPEIEMLQFVLFLVCRDLKNRSLHSSPPPPSSDFADASKQIERDGKNRRKKEEKEEKTSSYCSQRPISRLRAKIQQQVVGVASN